MLVGQRLEEGVSGHFRMALLIKQEELEINMSNTKPSRTCKDV